MVGWAVAIAAVLAQGGKTALIVPDWKACGSTYDAENGLAIRCDPVVMIEVSDVPGKPSPAMLDLMRSQGWTARAQTFTLAGKSVEGMRQTEKKDSVTLVLLTAVVATRGQARLLSCMTAEVTGLEGVCTSAFDFFAGPVDLAQWQAAKSRVPWGRAKPDAKLDARVRKLVDDAVKSPASLLPACASSVVVGPGLWYWLTQNDTEQEKIGTRSSGAGPNGSYPMRSYNDAAQLSAFLGSRGATALFKRFAKGKVRAASDDERKVFYSTIPFEIDGLPISVVDRGQTQLLMYLAEGKIAWLELMTDPEKQDFVKGP